MTEMCFATRVAALYSVASGPLSICMNIVYPERLGGQFGSCSAIISGAKSLVPM